MSEDRSLQILEGEFKVQDVRPVLTPDEARAAMQAYQDIVTAVTDEGDYQTFVDDKGKPHKFRKRSGWKKLERFFFVSVEVRSLRPFHRHNPNVCLRVKMPDAFKDVPECGCPYFGVTATMRAIDTRSGRFSENTGTCTLGERRVPAGASLHDLTTRAVNRGANRAVADLLGVSDPSAEEAQAEQGFSREERLALRTAWDEASPERRNQALQNMARAGAAGKDTRETYIDFLKKGSDDDYEAVLRLLRGQDLHFDPDEVPTE